MLLAGLSPSMAAPVSPNPNTTTSSIATQTPAPSRAQCSSAIVGPGMQIIDVGTSDPGIDKLDSPQLAPASDVNTPSSTQSNGASSGRIRYGSNTSETLSVSSYGSSDTQSLRGGSSGGGASAGVGGGVGGGEESSNKASSPAATTLRPRFGKEYSRVDRRKLVEELSLSDSSPVPQPPVSAGGGVVSTNQSPSTTSSVFTFDVASMASSRGSFISDSCSTDNDSPKSPSVYSRMSARETPDHVYMNICFPNARSGSPLIVDTRPGSALSGMSSNAEQSNALLNYAEIDLSGSGGEEGSKKVGKSRRGGERVEYAMIDMVATAAASRVGKEHAKQREDSLRRKDSFRRAESEGWRKGKDRKGATMNGRDRKSSTGKNSSKDRKFSSPM